jgi:hypothetical protein
LASVSNCSLSSSKLITLLVNSNYNQSNITTEDDSLVFLGERISAIIFLPNQFLVVKKLLQETQAKENNFTPRVKAHYSGQKM